MKYRTRTAYVEVRTVHNAYRVPVTLTRHGDHYIARGFGQTGRGSKRNALEVLAFGLRASIRTDQDFQRRIKAASVQRRVSASSRI